MPEDTWTLATFNVNGLRAAVRKGFGRWRQRSKADVICLQEIRMQPDQLEREHRSPRGWRTVRSDAVKKGYSGVAVWSRLPIVASSTGCGLAWADSEGRIDALRRAFDNLNRAHAAVLKARAQIERLGPLVADGNQHVEISAEIEELTDCRDALSTWFASRRIASSSLLSSRPSKYPIIDHPISEALRWFAALGVKSPCSGTVLSRPIPVHPMRGPVEWAPAASVSAGQIFPIAFCLHFRCRSESA